MPSPQFTIIQTALDGHYRRGQDHMRDRIAEMLMDAEYGSDVIQRVLNVHTQALAPKDREG